MAEVNKEVSSNSSDSDNDTPQVNIDEIISKIQDAPTEICDDVMYLYI